MGSFNSCISLVTVLWNSEIQRWQVRMPLLTCLDNIVLHYPGGWFSMNLACFYSPQELPVMFSFLYTSTSSDCDLQDMFEHFCVSLITVGSVWVKWLKLLLFEDPYCDNDRRLSHSLSPVAVAYNWLNISFSGILPLLLIYKAVHPYHIRCSCQHRLTLHTLFSLAAIVLEI